MLGLDTASWLAGIPQRTLINRIGQRAFQPTRRGRPEGGRGSTHQFSVSATVGLIVGEALRRGEIGCSLEYTKKIYRAFAGVSEEWLRTQLERGNTHFVMITRQGKPLLQPQAYNWVSVADAYRRIQHEVKQQRLRARSPVR